MSKLVLTGVRAFTHGVDLTNVTNKVEVTGMVEDKDITTYGSQGWHEHLGGLGQAAIATEGFWEAGTLANIDDTAWATLGSIGPWTIAPVDANEGSLAYLTRALRTAYTPFSGSVGDVAAFTTPGEGSWPLARGQVASSPGTARTTTGTGTILTMTGPTAGQFVYGNLHVLSVAGTTPSITARIESATTVGFGSPTTRATFTAANTIGGEAIRAAGPITDGFWRLAWTITGTTPSFLIAAAIGIK